MSADDQAQAVRHCASLVRQEDRSSYAARLFLGEPLRDCAFVIDAFRLETQRIPFLASEPMPGEIRLQWWREVIEGERAVEAMANPVSRALLRIITEHDLPVPAFSRYLDALAFELYHDPMPDMASFEGWAGETASFLLQAIALCGNGSGDSVNGSALADACGHGGLTLAIARLLRLACWHRQREQVFLPEDFLKQYTLDRRSWLALPGEAHHSAVRAFATLGLEHADRAIVAAASLNNAVRPVFLPLREAMLVLETAERDPARAFDGRLAVSPLAVQWRYWKSALRGFR